MALLVARAASVRSGPRKPDTGPEQRRAPRRLGHPYFGLLENDQVIDNRHAFVAALFEYGGDAS